MNGVRFYLEPTGTVLAVFTDPALSWVEGGQLHRSAVGGVYAAANSPAASTSATASYIATCTRISERRARKVHPLLFELLA